MIANDNKDIVRRFFADVLSGNNPAAARDLIDPALVSHHPWLPGGTGGVPEVIDLMNRLRAVVSELRYVVDDMVAEGNTVAVRWTATGRHTGAFGGIPPTGRTTTIGGMDMFRLGGNRIVETWTSSDLLGLIQQIGPAR
jgi:predicted ester cyclase